MVDEVRYISDFYLTKLYPHVNSGSKMGTKHHFLTSREFSLYTNTLQTSLSSVTDCLCRKSAGFFLCRYVSEIMTRAASLSGWGPQPARFTCAPAPTHLIQSQVLSHAFEPGVLSLVKQEI